MHATAVEENFVINKVSRETLFAHNSFVDCHTRRPKVLSRISVCIFLSLSRSSPFLLSREDALVFHGCNSRDFPASARFRLTVRRYCCDALDICDSRSKGTDDVVERGRLAAVDRAKFEEKNSNSLSV